MRGYELCLIFHPDTGENDIDTLTQSLGDVVSKHDGVVIEVEKWGKKNLKHQIKKQSKGLFCFMRFTGPTETLADIERQIRFNETVMRYNTVRLPTGASLEPVVPEVEEPPAAPQPEETETSASPESTEAAD